MAISTVGSISLSNVLKDFRLTTKMKLIIAYTLAYSIWRYYSSDWMKNRWTTESIHFMSIQSTKEPTISLIYAHNACLAVDFGSSEEVVSEYLDGPVSHSHPRMLTLGTLLVEIARDDLRTPDQRQKIGSLRRCITQEHVRALQVIREDLAWPHLGGNDQSNLTKDIYRDITTKCLDRNFFRSFPFSSSTTEQGFNRSDDALQDNHIDRRRYLIWRKVVAPLGALLNRLGWGQDWQSIEPMQARSYGRDSTSSGYSPTIPTVTQPELLSASDSNR